PADFRLRGRAREQSWPSANCLRQLFRQRVQFEFSDEQLGPFGLHEDLAVVRNYVRGPVYHRAVHAINQATVSRAERFDLRPLLLRRVNIFRPPDAQHVGPIGIATKPIDASLGETDAFATGGPNGFTVPI